MFSVSASNFKNVQTTDFIVRLIDLNLLQKWSIWPSGKTQLPTPMFRCVENGPGQVGVWKEKGEIWNRHITDR